ncbi:MAG: NifB/NifX family molybdenum-iron cluster-binding protein [Thermodesulfobacteriota bacterium]
MKIAVSAAGPDLSDQVDPRFGRAAYFIIVNPETMTFEAVENVQNLNLPQGAGIQAGKTVVNSGADILLTGNCGPKAFAVLRQAGVDVAVSIRGTVAEAVAAYKRGELKPAREANVEAHWV